MDKVRRYLQHHPFVRWLVTVAITPTLMLCAALLLHETNWPLLAVFGVGVPTATFFTRRFFNS